MSAGAPCTLTGVSELWRTTPIIQICARRALCRHVRIGVQIGGYVRIAADQRWLQTVIRFQAGHRAKRRLGA